MRNRIYRAWDEDYLVLAGEKIRLVIRPLSKWGKPRPRIIKNAWVLETPWITIEVAKPGFRLVLRRIMGQPSEESDRDDG